MLEQMKKVASYIFDYHAIHQEMWQHDNMKRSSLTEVWHDISKKHL
jgi:hypothetical protein